MTMSGSLSGEDIHLACDALTARIERNWGACEMFSTTENAQLRWISRKLREMSLNGADDGEGGYDRPDAYRPGLVAAGVLRAIADKDSSCRERLSLSTLAMLDQVMQTMRRIADEPPAPRNRHERRAAASQRGTIH